MVNESTGELTEGPCLVVERIMEYSGVNPKSSVQSLVELLPLPEDPDAFREGVVYLREMPAKDVREIH